MSGTWRRLTRTQHVLIGANAVLTLGLVWIVSPLGDALPLAVAESPAVPVVPEPTGERSPPSLDSATALVTRNPFSRSRTPPGQRWSATAPPPIRQPVRRPVAPAPPRYELLGAVVSPTPGQSMAVIEADPRKPGPEVYRIGDPVGPYRLVTIERDRVILSGNGRTIELRLEPLRPARPRPDRDR